ncbi:hypothetical protein BYT27DRAFT_7338861 [Phlegmacium glaucopus]|nr:hypothetical protein BYT27DRAFT_7338861 [Phlegmacium glaucopus]
MSIDNARFTFLVSLHHDQLLSITFVIQESTSSDTYKTLPRRGFEITDLPSTLFSMKSFFKLAVQMLAVIVFVSTNVLGTPSPTSATAGSVLPNPSSIPVAISPLPTIATEISSVESAVPTGTTSKLT